MKINESDLEQQLTMPYDQQGIDVESGRHELRRRLRANRGASPRLAGGDIDAQWEMAESGGEETVAGSMATPDQNVVEENAQAIGITYHENEQLRCGEKERQRDIHRWELDPASADDYRERAREEAAATPGSRFVRWAR